MSVRLRRIEPGAYGVHGKPNLVVLAHFADWAIWDNEVDGYPWSGELFRGPTLAACRKWLDVHE